MHPAIGPAAEAEALYVRQLRLPERLRAGSGELVVWDIGLGGAANVLAVLKATASIPGKLRVASFDVTLEPLQFACVNAAALGYFAGYEPPVRALLEQGRAHFHNGLQEVFWEAYLGDFPSLLQTSPARHWPSPHAILFDPFSPAKNPGMWTLGALGGLRGLLDAGRPCLLATYSRSTLVRATLLLAGFFVGRGEASGQKEETTVAATAVELLEYPLHERWLERARKSTSAEPLSKPVYRQSPLSPASWAALKKHPQFRSHHLSEDTDSDVLI